jgi:hypothetical protein
MTRRHFPGQHTFHIISDKAKQVKRRADSQKRMAILREKRLKEQYNNNLPSDPIIAEQAIQRYALHIYLKLLQVLLT